MKLALKNIAKRKKLALCVGSGAARGYAAIPIIRQFCDDHIEFSMASGSSAGAVITAYYALYGEVDSLYRKLTSLSKSDWLSLVDLNNPTKSLIKGKKIREFYKKELFRDASFSDLSIPLYIAATSLKKRKTVYFYEGSLLDAIMASIAIPGVFMPYPIEDDYYIDGGVKADLPYEILLKKGADKVAAISFSKISKSREVKVDSALQVLLNAFQMMREEKTLPESVQKQVYVFEPEFERNVGDSFKFYLTKENYLAGEDCLKHQYKHFLHWL